ELVRDQVVVAVCEQSAEQDQIPGRVAVEAPEPREPEERRRDQYAHAVDPHGTRIPVEPVESRLRASECAATRLGRPGDTDSLPAPVLRRRGRETRTRGRRSAAPPPR